MARPKNTSQYPEDEAILDQIERDMQKKRFPSGHAAIVHYLDAVEGPSGEAKVRRLLRKLRSRRLEREDDIASLAQQLEGLGRDERIRHLRRLHELPWSLEEAMQEARFGLEEAGISRDSEDYLVMLRAWIKARAKDSSKRH